jgi:hypothetical protein
MREPTAAELRHQCNIALANDADGVMFYALVSCPGEFAVNRWWPATRQQWVDDSSLYGQTGGEIDMNAGMMGYLDENLDRRRCDWNGESKWDSTVAYINTFLRPVADTIQQNLLWRDAKIWSIRNYADAGANTMVNEVLGIRQDAADPIDAEDSTFVMVSEFGHRITMDQYLFVLNGRTHPTEGHRHITVKLSRDVGPDQQWLVENVITGDVWAVRPTSSPDSTTTANGFTDYFAPGSAALYRLLPMNTETLAFLDTCFAHTFTVTPGAVLSRAHAPVRLAHNARFVVEDSTILTNCVIECCDLEGKANIFVRNGGALQLEGSTLSPTLSRVSRVPVSVGPDSRFTSKRTIYSGIPGDESALSIVGGHAFMLENAIDLGGGGTFVSMWGGGELLSRRDSVQGNAGFFSLGIDAKGGRSFIEGDRFLNVGVPLMAHSGSLIQGCDTAAPVIGRNKFRANYIAMYCEHSEMFFGERPWGSPGNWFASQNSIGILDPTQWYHASAPSGVIYAHANFWGQGGGTPLQACAPNVYGNVSTNYALTADSVPFTGGRGSELSKSSLAASAPPANIREIILDHLANGARADARSAIASFLQNGGGSTAGVQDLAFLYRTAKQVDGQSLVADILSVLDNRQDLRGKLLASDILEQEDDLTGALSILDSYSFAGSDTLLRDAFLRKAILHPLAAQGGYVRGLAALDTLATLVAFDSTLPGFIERYPRLMSNLLITGRSAVPKTSTSAPFRQALPEDIDVWPNYPNPFSDVTSFTFKLGEDKHVRLAVYDAMGREVAVVTDAAYTRGVHSAVLRSGHLPSGLYFYRLTTESGVIQRKMLLMR